MNQVDPSVEGVLVAIRVLLLAVGAALANHGLAASGAYFWVELLAGSTLSLGSAAWMVVASIVKLISARDVALAVGTQAGINMTLAGKAVDANGRPIVKLGPAAGAPKPVTLETATAIAADYGPAASTIARD